MAKTIVDEKRAAIVTEGEAVDGQEKDLMKILCTDILSLVFLGVNCPSSSQ